MQLLLKIIDKLNKLVYFIVGSMAIVMFLLIISQIISRSILSNSISWSEELARYLMIWIVFLGAALALRERSLIAIELLTYPLKDKWKKRLQIVVYIICTIFFTFILIYGIDLLQFVKVQSSPTLPFSMAIPYASIPVSAVFLIMNSLAILLELFTKRHVDREGEVT
ncbi:TRAP transporter small permease [Virgibacillus byunsanensis]|uniref:TRAP transporter small permease n=1 Tax=Virgibacillus byunsanensis TaxID=570945 RepID=A0ABW3LP26_9BACI